MGCRMHPQRGFKFLKGVLRVKVRVRWKRRTLGEGRTGKGGGFQTAAGGCWDGAAPWVPLPMALNGVR